MTTQDPQPVKPKFHVTQQTETTVIGDNGRVQRVMAVSFSADDGIVGSVNVPIANYSVDTVRTAILAKLATLQAIANLTN